MKIEGNNVILECSDKELKVIKEINDLVGFINYIELNRAFMPEKPPRKIEIERYIVGHMETKLSELRDLVVLSKGNLNQRL